MPTNQYYYVEALGDLFYRVQLERVFADAKYFVDCTPRADVAVIVAAYAKLKDDPSFDLKLFVATHFILPSELHGDYLSTNKPILQNLKDLWTVLKRTPDVHGGTLLALPFPYIVPGGRFREIFYWDSYFTMLGLQVTGEAELIEGMVKNVAFLIDQIGHVPNGNRTYFISRSQPPFFCGMLEILAEFRGPVVMQQYLPQLEKEYAFWMAGLEQTNDAVSCHRRVVRLPGGAVLNRYWDDKDTARAEAFFEDSRIARDSGRPLAEVHRHMRAACESGWDFSSRWCRVAKEIGTIETANIVPVDLNCLLLHLEETLLKLYNDRKDIEKVKVMQAACNQRFNAIQQYGWNEGAGFYFDYHHVDGVQTERRTLAAVFPLFFKVAKPEQAKRVAELLETDFLKAGGLVSTLMDSGQQWDEPNGWAPLQWMAYKGLLNYGFNELAGKVRERWMKNCEGVYVGTGKMMEKYNVLDVSEKAVGGKYPNQDGFGWTNGVYLRMSRDVAEPMPVVVEAEGQAGAK